MGHHPFMYRYRSPGTIGNDPAAGWAPIKEGTKPPLPEKIKRTEQQVDRNTEISFEQQRQRRELRNNTRVPAEDKKKQMEELDSARGKKFSD